MPDAVVDGENISMPNRRDGSQAGLIFYNSEGDECGGLVYGNKKSDNGNSSFGLLAFDQYKQDQTVFLSYNDLNGNNNTGLSIVDRPINKSIIDMQKLSEEISKMPDGQEKEEALKKLMEGTAKRTFIGKTDTKDSVVVLSDAKGLPRLVLKVSAEGEAKIEFYDDKGNVTSSFP